MNQLEYQRKIIRDEYVDNQTPQKNESKKEANHILRPGQLRRSKFIRFK